MIEASQCKENNTIRQPKYLLMGRQIEGQKKTFLTVRYQSNSLDVRRQSPVQRLQSQQILLMDKLL